MARRKKWQSGNADLVSVAIGLVILSITASGTAMSMLYGRDALARQERYKAASYLLKREMEKVQWELKSFDAARAPGAFNGRRQYSAQLQSPNVFATGNQPVFVTLTMEPLVPVPDPNHQGKTAYWILTMHAAWDEPEMGLGSERHGVQQQEIAFTTAVDNSTY